ncbi:hypothetical protein SBA4_2150034 [Candidatus Sulfopaludibacter sp. SbA4]|nr:hypothetical protein SBA4_2150034 [Candidatus Sulfopaludibacter sp. SbA4]
MGYAIHPKGFVVSLHTAAIVLHQGKALEGLMRLYRSPIIVPSPAPSPAPDPAKISGGGIATGATASDTTTIGNRCDVNGDGVVNVGDVQTLINVVLGAVFGNNQTPLFDLNRDGFVNLADIQIAINVALGASACPI